MTSVLERALSRRRSRKTRACSSAAKVNEDFFAAFTFMLLSYLGSGARTNLSDA